MQPALGSLIISWTHTWEEAAQFQGLQLGFFLPVRRGLTGIHIPCASFPPVVYPSEENLGGELILLSKEGLGAKWRQE